MKTGIWLPVYGGWLRTLDHEFDPSYEYSERLAVKAEQLGYDYVYGSENFLNCVYPDQGTVDPWCFLAGIAARTSRIGLGVASTPGFKLPATVAHTATTIDRMSHGRLFVNVVTGWWRQEFEGFGADFLDHARRYERADEYVQVLKGLWTSERWSYGGKHYRMQDGTLRTRPHAKPHPPVWIGGQSDQAIDLAIKEADVLFVNSAPPETVAKIVAEVRRRAGSARRPPAIAMSALVIQADSDDGARRHLDRLFAQRSRDTIDELREIMKDSGAQMWKGLTDFQMLDSNCGLDAGLLGTPRTIAARIEAFREAGVEVLILQFEHMMDGLVAYGTQVLPATRRGLAVRAGLLEETPERDVGP